MRYFESSVTLRNWSLSMRAPRVAEWRKRDKDAQALHADLVMLARLSQALSRARGVCLAA
jgi:hypothetical protein